MAGNALIIACGALARELVEIRKRNGWEHLRIQCLPANLHHSPAKIPAAVDEMIGRFRDEVEHIYVAYGDCGTSGELDRVLEKHGVERIPGEHCFEFFPGKSVFDALAEEELGTFYLTDFLVRQFEHMVVKSLGMDRHPELKDLYFGNYKRLVYLIQNESAALSDKARAQAEYLGLEYEERHTGFEPVEAVLKEQVVQWRN